MYCENTVHAALDAAGTNVLAVHIRVGYDDFLYRSKFSFSNSVMINIIKSAAVATLV